MIMTEHFLSVFELSFVYGPTVQLSLSIVFKWALRLLGQLLIYHTTTGKLSKPAVAVATIGGSAGPSNCPHRLILWFLSWL